MEIVEQFAFDFDWFFLDKSDHLCHVASASGRLPNGVSEMQVEELQRMSTLVRQLPERFDYEINPLLEGIKSFDNETQRFDYISDFVEFAKRGLYSFDKSNINNFEDNNYHLVAYPKDKVTLGSPYFSLIVLDGIVEFEKFRVNDHFFLKRNFKLLEIKFLKGKLG